VNQNKESWG